METPAVITGIDPGITGAIAAIDNHGHLLWVEDMPTANGTIAIPLLTDILEDDPAHLIAIEAVHSMPKQGVASTFKFGVAYGVALGVASRWPCTLVTPTEWKKSFRLNGKPKDASRELAIRTWPVQADWFKTKKRGQARADAAFIALHVLRVGSGGPVTGAAGSPVSPQEQH